MMILLGVPVLSFGVLPVFVMTCDAITDTLARESILAYAVERREPTATS